MFDHVKRELHRIDGDRISISIPADTDGYLDRECPSPACAFGFKILGDDWRDKVRDEQVFCPFCGHAADAHQWSTGQQVAHAKAAAIAEIQNRFGNALRRDADAWNRRASRTSLVRMTMQVNSQPRQLSLPSGVAATMQLKVACPSCSCRYAVIGSAFFCPACGHNAADLMFFQGLGAIHRALDAIPGIRVAILDRDIAENTCRLLVENGLQSVITSFQRYAEALYARFPNVPEPRRNAFQNVGEGSSLWYRATGKRYVDYLEVPECASLVRYFQQRHLIAHTQGLVDDDYIARAGDTTYRPGQRLVIREAAVRECLELIAKLATSMAIDATGPREPSV